MNAKLIMEYIAIQIVLLFLIYFYLKDFIKLWKSNPGNGNGIRSTLSVSIGLISFSIVAFYMNIVKGISFWKYFIGVISEIFK